MTMWHIFVAALQFGREVRRAIKDGRLDAVEKKRLSRRFWKAVGGLYESVDMSRTVMDYSELGRKETTFFTR